MGSGFAPHSYPTTLTSTSGCKSARFASTDVCRLLIIEGSGWSVITTRWGELLVGFGERAARRDGRAVPAPSSRTGGSQEGVDPSSEYEPDPL